MSEVCGKGKIHFHGVTRARVQPMVQHTLDSNPFLQYLAMRTSSSSSQGFLIPQSVPTFPPLKTPMDRTHTVSVTTLTMTSQGWRAQNWPWARKYRASRAFRGLVVVLVGPGCVDATAAILTSRCK